MDRQESNGLHKYAQFTSRTLWADFYLITDWFPGWAKKYGAEPSSLTPSEDCVELRQAFPGLIVHDEDDNDITDASSGSSQDLPVKNQQLYWSDQECRVENWFICGKPMIHASPGTFSTLPRNM